MLRLSHLLCLVSPTGPPVALRQGLHLAASCEASLSVMPMGPGTQAGATAALRDERDRGGETASSVPTEVLPAPDEPLLEAIQSYVENGSADLLVADSFFQEADRPPLASGNTRKLIEEVDTPLFLVDQCRAPTSVRRLLVPTDLSDQSLKTLHCAVKLAACYEASVVLLHVLDTSPYVALTPVDRLSLGSTTLPEHRARRRLRQFVKGWRADDVTIDIRLAFGDPGKQIARAFEEEAADLLVISSRGAEAQGQPLGPVAERVLQRVSIPLFLFRAAGGELLSTEDARTNAKGSPE